MGSRIPALIGVISLHLLGGAEENYGGQDNGRYGWYSDRSYSEQSTELCC
jgi:hypothetical protein